MFLFFSWTLCTASFLKLYGCLECLWLKKQSLMYLQLSAQVGTAGEEAGLTLESWKLCQNVNLILMIIRTRHVSQVVSSNVQVLAVFLQQLYSQRITVTFYFCLWILCPCHIPPACFLLWSSIFSSSLPYSWSFCDFLCIITLHILSVSLLSHLNSHNDHVEIVGPQ